MLKYTLFSQELTHLPDGIESLSSYSLKLTHEQNQVYFPLRTPIPTIINCKSNLTIQNTPPCRELHHNGCSFFERLPRFQSIQGNLHRTTYFSISFLLSPYNTPSLTLFVWIYMGSGLVSSPQIELHRIQLKTKTTQTPIFACTNSKDPRSKALLYLKSSKPHFLKDQKTSVKS